MEKNQYKRNTAALTLIEALVVIATLIIVAGLLLPALARTRRGSGIRCMPNLKQIGLSFRMWAGDNAGKFPMQVSVTNGGTMELIPNKIAAEHFIAMSNELNDPKILLCPQDNNRRFAIHFASLRNTSVSYFVGLDANNDNPHAILSGDRNVAADIIRIRPGLVQLPSNTIVRWTADIHTNTGNILFADGSVQRIGSDGLLRAFRSTGLATNHLLLP